MRIAVIAHVKYPISDPFAGGLEMHTNLLVSQLQARDHDVTLFAADGSDSRLNVEPICSRTAIDRVGTAEAQDVNFFREHHAYLHLMTMLRSRNFDIVHNNSLHYLPVVMADTLPMPMVSLLHTPPFCWLESGIRSGRGSGSRFVAISQTVARMWSNVLSVDHVVYNGIELDRFPFQPCADSDHYLVWHGRIVPEKGTHLAIEAAMKTPYRLRIAGPIHDRDYFDQQIAPHLGAKISYEGHLGHDQLPALLGGAVAALCTPRWEEPHGLVVAEALACGIPVAAFDRGAIGEIVTPLTGVLATPDDPTALARAAMQATTLERSDCRRRAEQFCGVRQMTLAYEQIYAECISQRDGSSSRQPFGLPSHPFSGVAA